MLKKNRKNNQGMTMIEILVSISIIVIILGLYTVNYHAANRRTQIILSAQTIVSNLRLAQSYAASAKRFNENVSSNVWGVYFDKTKPSEYIMFNDVNNNGTYDLGEQFRLFKLHAGIEIASLEYADINGDYYQFNDDNLAITFIPPDPETKFKNGSNYEDKPRVVIVLHDNTNDSTKKIGVNFFGLIDVL